jgi:hypothetical protein
MLFAVELAVGAKNVEYVLLLYRDFGNLGLAAAAGKDQ